MTYTQLRYETLESIALLTLERPEKRNALSVEMTDSLVHALSTAQADPAVKAVVVTGTGAGFCAGGDIQEMLEGKLQAWDLKRYLWDRIERVLLQMEDMDKLVVAAVNGPAAGAGFDLALACDVRVGTDAASFISAYVRLGLAPGFGGCFFLPRIVGLGRAMEILLSGRRVTAEEALNMGILNCILPADNFVAQAVQWTSNVVQWPLPALKVIKRGVYQGLASNLRHHLDYLSSQDALLSMTEEHLATLEKIRNA